MKIIHTADWHLGKNLEGQSRLAEQKRFLDDFVSLCEREKCDMVLIAGDIYDSYNPPALAEQYFYDTLKKLSRGGACMTVVIAGNHDNPERLTASGPLAKEHGIVMAGTPQTAVPTGIYGENEITASDSGYFQATVNGEKVDVVLVPFPSERRLGEIYLEETDEETTKAKSYSDRMAALFASLAGYFRPDSLHLAVSHLFVMDSVEAGSERSIQLGGSYMVSGSILPETADYIALGHVHKPQKVPGCPQARYSGSPIPYSLKEASFKKQVLCVTLTVGQPCQITEIPLPAYKPIEAWECASIADAIAKCAENQDRDCWVYLKIHTDTYIHEEDIKQMRALKSDILSIMPILSGQEGADTERVGMEQQPFDVLVKDFYQKKFQTEMPEETFRLLLGLMEED